MGFSVGCRCTVHDKRSRTRNRAIAVLAHEQGFPIRRIAACLEISRNTVRRHIRTYTEGGAEKLVAPMSRKPVGVDRDQLKEAVFRLLHEPPKDHGINRTSWIMADLRMVLARQGFPACLQVIRKVSSDNTTYTSWPHRALADIRCSAQCTNAYPPRSSHGRPIVEQRQPRSGCRPSCPFRPPLSPDDPSRSDPQTRLSRSNSEPWSSRSRKLARPAAEQ